MLKRLADLSSIVQAILAIAAVSSSVITWLNTQSPMMTVAIGAAVGVVGTLLAVTLAKPNASTGTPMSPPQPSGGTGRTGYRVHPGGKLRTLGGSVQNQETAFDVGGDVETHNTEIK